MLIRSHEVPPSNKGYEVRHNGRCVTVFSASNYCGHRGNSGAVMVFQPDLYALSRLLRVVIGELLWTQSGRNHRGTVSNS